MAADGARVGPLVGLRVVEFAGIGPGPHAAMLLGDLGAEVLRIDRPGGNGYANPIVDRGRAALTLDLRSEDGRTTAAQALALADVLIEGFRPGTMERLGLGPEPMLAANPRLVYGRMTGWGQEGPLAKTAGHDIGYIALTGALAAIGKPGAPAQPPLNLVGDFGGGSLYLVFGIMAALWERERSGRGQVVDAAIIDGVASMMTMFTGLAPSGRISLDRADNFLGGAAPYYRCYVCADGREIALGALEPQFWAAFCALIEAPAWLSQERSAWDATTAWLTERFASRPASYWTTLFAGSDACAAPVLHADEAPMHPHHVARGSFVAHDGLVQPAAAPRFSRTPGGFHDGDDGAAVLTRWRANSR